MERVVAFGTRPQNKLTSNKVDGRNWDAAMKLDRYNANYVWQRGMASYNFSNL